MKITAITISINYSDFFQHVALSNKNLFYKWIVVTDTKDTLTDKICKENNITCLKTDVFYKDGKFNKFAGINEALKLVDDESWILFLDSDIVLHPLTKRVLEELILDKTCIYGVDRLNCTGIEKYEEYKRKNNLIIDNWLLTSAGMELGSRINHYYGQQGENGKYGGYKVLGFFQLAHTSQFKEYPYDCTGFDHCDLVFSNMWPRNKRILIPEILGIHLESVGSKWGDNWKGRKSKSFSSGIKLSLWDKFILWLYEVFYIPDYNNKCCLTKIIKKLIYG